MRMRTILAASLLAATAVLGGAGMAAADTEGFSLVNVDFACAFDSNVPIVSTVSAEPPKECLPR
jgi:hypothetical protein